MNSAATGRELLDLDVYSLFILENKYEMHIICSKSTFKFNYSNSAEADKDAN